MDNNLLQLTLRSGLFDIGDNDDRLAWLQQSVDDLVKFLKKNYSLLPTYSLIALDPNISDQEPLLNTVERFVTTYWKALRGKYPDMPRNIHRGVILNALYELREDPIAARIIYFASSSYYPYARLGKEKEMVQTLLSDLGEIAEKHAIQEWSLIENEPKLKIGTLKISELKTSSIIVDKAKIKSGLESGLKAQSESGHQLTHGLHEPNFQAAYLSKTSEGLANALNSAFKEFNQVELTQGIESSINKFFTDFKKSLDENLKVSFATIQAVERRSKLLWWKETLYSPSLMKSYRDVSKMALPVVMGFDLNSQVAKITPVSVDYLLKDTIYLLDKKSNNPMKFKDLLSGLAKDPEKELLSKYFEQTDDTTGRISITSFVSLFINDKVKAQDFSERTGIREDDEISLGDFSVAIFQDLLTNRLIAK